MQKFNCPDYNLFESLIVSFSEKELSEKRESHDHYPFNSYPTELLSQGKELGMFDLLLPESAAGLDQSMHTYCKLLTKLSQYNASIACVLLSHSLAQEVLAQTQQLDKLPKKAEGRTRLPILAFSSFDNPIETAPQLFAKDNAGSYLVSGKIDYLSMGGLATHAVVAARSNDHGAFSYFLISMTDPGVETSKTILGLGLNLCPAVDATVSNVGAILLGETGQGASLFQTVRDRMSIAGGAIAVGLMQASLSEALDYSHTRTQGGRCLINWTEVTSILATMNVATCNAEMALNWASIMIDDDAPGWRTRAQAVAASAQDHACEVTTNGIQVLGGAGYMKDYGQERRFRDATHLQSLLGNPKLKPFDCLKLQIKDLKLEN